MIDIKNTDSRHEGDPSVHGPLTPSELAISSFMGGLAVVLTLFATLIPLYSLLLRLIATIPMALVAARYRARICVASAAATLLVSLVLGGVQSAFVAVQIIFASLVVGILCRRRAGILQTIIVSIVMGLIAGFTLCGLLLVLSDLRKVTLEAASTSLKGFVKIIGWFPGTNTFVPWANNLIDTALHFWWLWILLYVLARFMFTVILGHMLLTVTIKRLSLTTLWDPLYSTVKPLDVKTTIAPLPLSFEDVTFRYPESNQDALKNITFTINSGEFIVLEGHNGSGKSTLATIIAGGSPTSGSVVRSGAAGLGAIGGTALLSQRSETQLLGSTVREDVLWGLSSKNRDDIAVDELLDLVGLHGLADASPRHLSGGQLQRLSLAGALARKPALLISDESTAMIDPQGRRELIGILALLPQRGTTVVHITHDRSEILSASRVLTMSQGCLVNDTLTDGPFVSTTDTADIDKVNLTSPSLAPTPLISPGTSISDIANSFISDESPSSNTPAFPQPVERLWVDRVSHAYDVKTPWEHQVLNDVSLIMSPGDALLITGSNGSGKTTLSRIMAGLLRPTWGSCTLAEKPLDRIVGSVALSMQFARLQLQRPNVRTDILDAMHGSAALDNNSPEADRLVCSVMDEVGLDHSLMNRGIDELSGGQMRRVVLAGLFASNPKFLILDEPMAGIDSETRMQLIDALVKRRKRGLSLLVISHDVEGLDSLCTEHKVLSKGTLQ